MKKTDKYSSRSITPKQRFIFSIIMLSIPVIFLVLLEFSLRFFNYGLDISPFKEISVNGKMYYTLNPVVKNRYFNQTNFNPDPSPENFLVNKPPGTFRIFCLGGSTTVGFPYWYNGAFPSFLRDRLKAIFPDRSIEIINMGMTATNSYTVLDLAEDLLEYEPDLFIVYDGHNEFYGALGVASNETGITERWMARLYLQLIHLRTFQLLKSFISDLYSLFGKTPVDYSNRPTMMEQVAKGRNVPYNNGTYLNALDVFRQNLNDLTRLCQKQNIPLILGTQVSNLKDQSPFISGNSHHLSSEDRTRFQSFYKKGLGFQSRGVLDSAIINFRKALDIDSLYANIHYRLAQCLDSAGLKREAYNEYIFSRDYDELRFRTDSRFNNLIRSNADGRNCFVADIEKTFKSLSQDSLIGHNLILEHLHPNSKGNFLIAKDYAQLMKDNGLIAASDEWITIDEDLLWQHRHITDVDEFMAEKKIELLTAGWPFRKQYKAPPAVSKSDTLQLIADLAIHNRIGWVTAHNQAAEFYLKRMDFESTKKEYKTIINQIPFDATAYNKLAQIYFAQNKFDSAISVLYASLQVEQLPLTYRLLGDIYLKQRKPEEAIHYYEEIYKFPEDPSTAPENAYMLAFAYLKSEKPEKAISLLKQTNSRYPAYKPVKELLTKIMLVQNPKPE